MQRRRGQRDGVPELPDGRLGLLQLLPGRISRHFVSQHSPPRQQLPRLRIAELLRPLPVPDGLPLRALLRSRTPPQPEQQDLPRGVPALRVRLPNRHLSRLYALLRRLLRHRLPRPRTPPLAPPIRPSHQLPRLRPGIERSLRRSANGLHARSHPPHFPSRDHGGELFRRPGSAADPPVQRPHAPLPTYGSWSRVRPESGRGIGHAHDRRHGRGGYGVRRRDERAKHGRERYGPFGHARPLRPGLQRHAPLTLPNQSLRPHILRPAQRPDRAARRRIRQRQGLAVARVQRARSRLGNKDARHRHWICSAVGRGGTRGRDEGEVRREHRSGAA
ncbi:hypothetical protein EJ06DRAFT_355796 [Trichodelitschia bisporula]|uniref:Uncharacterized protein n=1 Tax=Trichodelitschia bisporula TaxID=703511 RepID=A0A6G1I082_9PEZI|nr:hypothetical protein EJ06DRAFT_355796 [Trichodelitschia bisporula]